VYDSHGRVPASLLSGNVNQYGDFDQCLRVEHRPQGSAETIKGQYVLAHFDLQVSGKVNNPQLEHLLTLAHSYDVITSNFSDVSATVGIPPESICVACVCNQISNARSFAATCTNIYFYSTLH
jgi:Nose resistant-to-fluoxetine protein, N-terminal domain